MNLDEDAVNYLKEYDWGHITLSQIEDIQKAFWGIIQAERILEAFAQAVWEKNRRQTGTFASGAICQFNALGAGSASTSTGK